MHSNQPILYYGFHLWKVWIHISYSTIKNKMIAVPIIMKMQWNQKVCFMKTHCSLYNLYERQYIHKTSIAINTMLMVGYVIAGLPFVLVDRELMSWAVFVIFLIKALFVISLHFSLKHKQYFLFFLLIPFFFSFFFTYSFFFFLLIHFFLGGVCLIRTTIILFESKDYNLLWDGS